MRRLLIVVAVILTVAAGLWLADFRQAKHKAYALGPVRVSYMVSPDGDFVAYGKEGFNEANQIVTRIVVRSVRDDSVEEIGEAIGGVWNFVWLGEDRLAFNATVTTPASEGRFFVMGLDGAQRPEISLPRDGDYSIGMLSPDGRRMVFRGEKRRWGLVPQEGVFLYDLESGEVRSLPTGNIQNPTDWSPDSRRLAFGGAGGYVADYPLRILDVDTGRVDETPVSGVGAAWSPNGRYIACITEGRAGRWYSGVPEGMLGVYDVSARTMRVLPGTEGATSVPRWSRSGEWIAYAARDAVLSDAMRKKDPDAPDAWKLFAVSSSGGAPKEIARSVTYGFRASMGWASDDILYAEVSSSTGNYDWETKRLIRADVSTREVRVIDEWKEPAGIPLGWSVKTKDV